MFFKGAPVHNEPSFSLSRWGEVRRRWAQKSRRRYQGMLNELREGPSVWSLVCGSGMKPTRSPDTDSLSRTNLQTFCSAGFAVQLSPRLRGLDPGLSFAPELR